MSYLLDDVARILARPASRRETFRLLGGILSRSLLGILGINRAKADDDEGGMCGKKTCGKEQKCCRTSSIHFCTDDERICCGKGTCGENQKCCGNTMCCGSHQSCGKAGTCSPTNDK